jgi:hypothetical protein
MKFQMKMVAPYLGFSGLTTSGLLIIIMLEKTLKGVQINFLTEVLGILLISFLINIPLLVITKNQFFYSIDEDGLCIRKFTKKIYKWNDVKSIQFNDSHLLIFFNNGDSDKSWNFIKKKDNDIFLEKIAKKLS